jgi:hypothetical protein
MSHAASPGAAARGSLQPRSTRASLVKSGSAEASASPLSCPTAITMPRRGGWVNALKH